MKPMFYVYSMDVERSGWVFTPFETYQEAEEFCENYCGQAKMLEIRKVWVKK